MRLLKKRLLKYVKKKDYAIDCESSIKIWIIFKKNLISILRVKERNLHDFTS